MLDYFEIVDPDTLDPVEAISRKTLVAVAAYVGTTRLIDNLFWSLEKLALFRAPILGGAARRQTDFRR